MPITQHQPPSPLARGRELPNLVLLRSILARAWAALPVLPPLGGQGCLCLLLLLLGQAGLDPGVGCLALVLERFEELVSWVGDHVE